MNIYEKKLNGIITNFKKICLAYSGGVDSSLLLFLASQNRPVIAVIIDGPMVKREDIKEAEKFAQSLPNVTLVKQPIDIFNIPEFKQNSDQRCYYCKKAIFESIKRIAQYYHCDVIFDGSNVDDLADYRPGLKAVREMEIISPFIETNITKDVIYYLSKIYNLPTKNKPASACLASRIKTNIPLTKENLTLVEEGEKLLSEYSFKQYRLRLIDDRFGYIEILREDFPLFDKNAKKIQANLKDLGITIEEKPREYHQGSMNEVKNE